MPVRRGTRGEGRTTAAEPAPDRARRAARAASRDAAGGTPRGEQPRGEATRERLLAAALDLFGRRGYEGVGARELTQAAGTPLSALPYYFGTKEALYRAVVARVCAALAEAVAPAVGRAVTAREGTPHEAAAALAALRGALLDVIAVRPEAESWARVLLREHLDPGPAFDLVYDDAARGAVELMAALIARAEGRAPDAEDVLLEAFACMGEILVFRTLRTAVVRRLGWRTIGPAEAARLRRALGTTGPDAPAPDAVALG